MENEIWKEIEGYTGIYLVSDLGKVKRIYKNGKERVIKPNEINSGYFVVNLCVNSKPKIKLVHRLVAEAFIPNPEKLSQVNHINEDKTDNRACNLEWCDSKHNIGYGTAIKRRSDKMKGNTYSNAKRKIMCVETRKIYDSVYQAGKQTGIYRSMINNVLRGRFSQTKGYHWKYVE